MKLKGTLKAWNDEKGFGFISPCAGGADVFAHISAFQNRSGRPRPGEVVIYHPERSEDGKVRAVSGPLADTRELLTSLRPDWRLAGSPVCPAIVPP